MPVPPVPPGYHTVTPYLIIHGAAAAIEFYKQALGATERMRFAQPDGRIGHAELEIGDSVVMLADEAPEMGFVGPQSAEGNTSVGLALYVDDVDTRFRQAIAAGARELRPVQNQFYGDRSGTLVDPFGHVWTLSTHVEDVSPEELERRVAAMHQGQH
jgi:PhnB protein